MIGLGAKELVILALLCLGATVIPVTILLVVFLTRKKPPGGPEPG